MDDGSSLAFFEAPDRPFAFKKQHDYDLHIALEVKKETLRTMLKKGKAAGIEVRGVADHGFIHSIYFRDPNGYVIELTAKHGDHESAMDPARNGARRELDSWQQEKPPARRARAPLHRGATTGSRRSAPSRRLSARRAAPKTRPAGRNRRTG
jgi:hypothetical protein